jgi:hypothetical protein
MTSFDPLLHLASDREYLLSPFSHWEKGKKLIPSPIGRGLG